MKWCYEFW